MQAITLQCISTNRLITIHGNITNVSNETLAIDNIPTRDLGILQHMSYVYYISDALCIVNLNRVKYEVI